LYNLFIYLLGGIII